MYSVTRSPAKVLEQGKSLPFLQKSLFFDESELSFIHSSATFTCVKARMRRRNESEENNCERLKEPAH